MGYENSIPTTKEYIVVVFILGVRNGKCTARREEMAFFFFFLSQRGDKAMQAHTLQNFDCKSIDDNANHGNGFWGRSMIAHFDSEWSASTNKQWEGSNCARTIDVTH